MKAALIGHGIAASLTPPMHEAEAKAQGFSYRYDRIDTALPEFSGKSIAELLDLAKESGCGGVNVTHPHKTTAFEVMDDLSAIARELRAVNTVVFNGDRMTGHNTDYSGFAAAFDEELGGESCNRVILFGAGGAGAAVALAVADAGAAELTVVDPDQKRAVALCRSLAALRPSTIFTARTEAQKRDLECACGVINATPLGMKGYPGMAVDPKDLEHRTWVADIVYFPLETELLAHARRCGLQTMSGAGMAIHQAAAAFQIITGRLANVGRMKETFFTLKSNRNLV